ncbi:hypothetical protein GCE86_19290 [Micromonospora terminaliae]|uniref:Tissue inhibitor of metalloproteinase n=1 Tax=Micromonospora terminaliae TaxID=1914461 RepID=A0AAJ2ZFN5_9ACTN|nr:hypothetical protein [Micromonospora terminaliae]NES29023.1 hypothetical protein [Micromonospora terminaliae]QGL48968.1 hypothetical protein GCE86_19290 [Micromonospora terminaliae]
MKLRAAILVALAALGLGLVVFVSPAQPAWACSCSLRPDQEDERADLIVVGTVTEVTDTAVQLAVESVEKGGRRADPALRLAVRPGEASCGYDFRAGGRYRVNSVGGATGLCVGIRQLPDRPSAPAAASTPATAAPPPARSPGSWWRPTAVALTVLAVGLVAAAWWRRRTGAGGRTRGPATDQ